MEENHGGGRDGRSYARSFKAKDELVDVGELGGGWTNLQVFLKASWRRRLKRKLDK